MLWKPVSTRPASGSVRRPVAAAIERASRSSAPRRGGSSVQCPAPVKMPSPDWADGLSAVVSPLRKRSTGVWSETSVDS